MSSRNGRAGGVQLVALVLELEFQVGHLLFEGGDPGLEPLGVVRTADADLLAADARTARLAAQVRSLEARLGEPIRGRWCRRPDAGGLGQEVIGPGGTEAQGRGSVVVVVRVRRGHDCFSGAYLARADLPRRLPGAERESQDRARAVEQEGASFHRMRW